MLMFLISNIDDILTKLEKNNSKKVVKIRKNSKKSYVSSSEQYWIILLYFKYKN